MLVDKIKQQIKDLKPSLYEEILREGITDDQLISNVGPIFQAIDETAQNNEYTVEIKINNGDLEFEYIANSQEAKLNEKLEKRNRQYVLKSFSNELLSIDLAEDVSQEIERKDALISISSIINNKENRGLYLHGTYGTGKTYMIIATLNRLADDGKTVAQINIADFLSSAKSRFDIKGDTFLKDTIQQLKNVDALLIDDIGGEVVSQWSREEILYPILNHRMENSKLTFFTSNLPLEKYAETLKIRHKELGFEAVAIGRLLERIKALSKEVFVGGRNHRYKK